MTQQYEAQKTPEQQAQHISDLLAEAQRACRTDSAQTSDPRAAALFTMLAEILSGAIKALRDYQWQERGTQEEVEEKERQFIIDIDQIEPSSKASAALPYD
jgi:hypothetical protein